MASSTMTTAPHQASNTPGCRAKRHRESVHSLGSGAGECARPIGTRARTGVSEAMGITTRITSGAGTSAVETILHIRLLGAFQVTVGGQPVPDRIWRLRKARSLIKLLALHPDQRLPREQAMDLLGPDLDPAAASNTLRGAIHAARRALAPHGTVNARG